MASSSYKKLFGFKDDATELNDDYEESGSEDEETDQEKVTAQAEKSHAKLLKSISSLDRKKKIKLKQRSEASAEVSEFNFTGKIGYSQDVKMHELMGSLANTESHSELKKQLSNVQKKKEILPTPLHKHEADKVRRTVAYNAVSNEVDKWDEVVERNRRLEHQSFPLNQPVIGIQTTEQFVKKFKPSTPLEQEVYKLLNGSKHIERPNNGLTLAEEEALQSLSLEEARERRAELQKTRALLSYYEAKCRRQKKIKSKTYHRIQRKSKTKEEAAKLQEKIKSNPEDAEEILQNLEKARAQERVTLKHRNTGKWAKGMIRFGKYDQSARNLIADQLEKSRELTKKIEQVNKEDDESKEAELEDEIVNPKVSLRDINNPWFAGSVSSKKEEVFVEPKVTALEPVVGQVSQESSDSEDDSMFEDVIDKLFKDEKKEGLKQKKKQPDQAQDVPSDDAIIHEELDQDEANSFHEMSDSSQKTPQPVETDSSERNQKNVEKEIKIDLSKVLTKTAKDIQSATPELIVDEDDEAESKRRAHLLNIQEAFAEDDVVKVFEDEKQEKIDRDKPKDVDLSLPGWGSWGGVGVRPKKSSRFIVKAKPAPPRRDDNLQHVLINENRDKKIAMHQVCDLPFPFANTTQFQRSIRAPIGSNWNTPSTVKKFTVPKVTTKLGTIIEPITAAETFKKTSKRKSGTLDGKVDLPLNTGGKKSQKQSTKKRRK